MADMIEIRNLCKSFGPITAVDDISFSVERGEVLGFLGPNGAGKSTTMKMLAGFLTPTGGTAAICGHDVQSAPLAAKRKLGYLPEGAPLYPDMTPASFLDFVAEVRGFRGADKRARVDRAVAQTSLARVLQQPIDTLSKGFKRRVGLAQAILHDPQVLILDEPTDGLDPNQKHDVRQLIRSMAEDKAIVLSTHILEEVDAVCTRVIIIAGGVLRVDCTPEEFAARSRTHNAVTLSVAAEQAQVIEQGLATVEGVGSVETRSNENGRTCLLVVPRDDRSIVAAVSRHAREADWEFEELHVEHGRLDEVFRELTSGPTAS